MASRRWDLRHTTHLYHLSGWSKQSYIFTPSIKTIIWNHQTRIIMPSRTRQTIELIFKRHFDIFSDTFSNLSSLAAATLLKLNFKVGDSNTCSEILDAHYSLEVQGVESLSKIRHAWGLKGRVYYSMVNHIIFITLFLFLAELLCIDWHVSFCAVNLWDSLIFTSIRINGGRLIHKWQARMRLKRRP